MTVTKVTVTVTDHFCQKKIKPVQMDGFDNVQPVQVALNEVARARRPRGRPRVLPESRQLGELPPGCAPREEEGVGPARYDAAVAVLQL